MLAEGIDLRQISDRLNTSIEYVYKEKGKLKKEGLLVTQQALSMSDGQHDITVVKDDSSLSSGTGYTKSNLSSYEMGEYDIPPLDEDKLKSMYSAFDNHKSPIYATAELGVHPAIADKEYVRFLRMKSRDPMELQRRLVSRIFNPTPQIQSIIDKSTKELLNNNELITLIEFRVQSQGLWYVTNTVSDVTFQIPNGIERPVCKGCHVPQNGVIFNRNMTLGDLAQTHLSNILCPNCRNKAQY